MKNLRVLSYNITNLSDDKPKFNIMKVSQIKKNSEYGSYGYQLNVWCEDSTTDLTSDAVIKFGWNCDTELTGIEFDVMFDATKLQIKDDTATTSEGCVVQKLLKSVVHVTVNEDGLYRSSASFKLSPIATGQAHVLVDDVTFSSPNRVYLDEVSNGTITIHGNSQ